MTRKYHSKKHQKRKLTWLWVTLGALLITAVGILALNTQPVPLSDVHSTQTVAAMEISPAEAYTKFEQGAFFLDVRGQDEWDQFHIQGSKLIPLDQLAARLAELPKDQDIVVVCLSGHRSQNGTTILLQAGFSHVYCLNGGLQAWKDANYPLE